MAVVNARATEASFSDVPLYPPVDPNDETATLTMRDTVWEKPVPRCPAAAGSSCRRARAPADCAGDAKCPRVAMAAGFEPGRIYELKYRASNPPVSGVGLAAVRAVASAVKYGNGAIVPVRGRYLHVYGASQSGRFLRLFLHDGFNVDEQGRKVFDGVMPHIAGAARSDFNTRFSQACQPRSRHRSAQVARGTVSRQVRLPWPRHRSGSCAGEARLRAARRSAFPARARRGRVGLGGLSPGSYNVASVRKISRNNPRPLYQRCLDPEQGGWQELLRR